MVQKNINIRSDFETNKIIEKYKSENGTATTTKAATELIHLGYKLYQLQSQSNDKSQLSTTDYLKEILRVLNRNTGITITSYHHVFDPNKTETGSFNESKQMVFTRADQLTNNFIKNEKKQHS